MAKRNKRNLKSPDAPLLHENHKRPVTRREFLGAGLVSGGAMVMAPSLMSLLAKPAFAADPTTCGFGGNASGTPFICIDLGGGANIAGSNVMVGGVGGQQDFISQAGYSKLGLPAGMLPGLAGQTNSELGLIFHSDSAFLRGILSKTSVNTRLNIDGAIIPARSNNDTSTNPHNPMYGIARAGAAGELLTLIGSRNSDSGGRSEAPVDMIDASIRPTQVASPSDAESLVDTGDLATLMPDNIDAGKVMKASEGISFDRIAAGSDQLPGGTGSVQDLVHCSYLKTTDTVVRFGGDGGFNPLSDTEIVDDLNPPAQQFTNLNNVADFAAIDNTTSIFSTNEINNDGMKRKTASIMKLVISGKAGAGTIEQGGYDYHTGTRAPGEIRDFRAGQCMGACLEYAARLGAPLMLYVFSDGSVASNGNIVEDAGDGPDGRLKPNWTGDNSSTAASFFLFYDPDNNRTNRPLMSPTSRQLGYFRANGSLETNGTTPGANAVNQLVEMVILNYMALGKDISNFATLFPNNGLGIRTSGGISAADIDKMIAFAF